MKSEECRERASHCFHLADTARSDQSPSTFKSLAQHWLRLAEELEHDQHSVEWPSATGRANQPCSGSFASTTTRRPFRRPVLPDIRAHAAVLPVRMQKITLGAV